MAGGVYGTNNTSYYLYNGQWYWTLSPWYYSSDPYVFGVNSNGSISNAYVSGTFGLRPVINLKANTTFKGTGTISDPYTMS